jgi:hypothetical protein
MDTARLEHLLEEHGEIEVRTAEDIDIPVDYGDHLGTEMLPAGSTVTVIGHDDSGYYRIEVGGSEDEGLLASQFEENIDVPSAPTTDAEFADLPILDLAEAPGSFEPATLLGVVSPPSNVRDIIFGVTDAEEQVRLLEERDQALAASRARHPAGGKAVFPLVKLTVTVSIPTSTDEDTAGAIADTITDHIRVQLTYGHPAQFIQNVCRGNGVEPTIEVTS